MADTDPPVIIITGDFVPTGGMDRANLALASALAAQGRALHLVAHRADESLLNYSSVTFHKVPRPLGSHWLGGPLLNAYGQKVAKSLARTARPQVIVNGGNCRTTLATVNWAHYVHAAWEPDQPATRQGMARRVKASLSRKSFLRHEKTAFQQAPLIIANSRLTANQISTAYDIPPDRIPVVYYGSDPATFGPVSPDERLQARQKLGLSATGPPVVLFVGALGDSRKGFDTLFQAWRLLNRHSPDWSARLLVVGSGNALPAYQQAVSEAGLNGQIQFLGFRHDVPELLAAADLLVSPASYEAYGLNVHEALCRGCPVLVSASAGVAERLPESSPNAPAAMRLPTDLTAETLARSLAHWRDHQPAYKNQAVEIGSMLRKETWAGQIQKLISLMNQPK